MTHFPYEELYHASNGEVMLGAVWGPAREEFAGWTYSAISPR